jgi:hypothetical protein
LPAPIVRQIVAPVAGHQATRHRRLLRIPAPAKKLDVAGAPVKQAAAGTQGLSTWMIVIVVLLALALGSGALLDRRRRRAGSG